MLQKNKLCIIGIFPPPLCGMSLINEYVRTRLIKEGVCYSLVDISPDSLDRKVFEKAKRLVRVCIALTGFLRLILTGRISKIYIGISGGWGQCYDTLFLMIARMVDCQIYIHHHNYAYLDKPWFLTRLLVLVAGKCAIHIVACEKMKNELQLCYPHADKVMVISGIAALDFTSCEYRQRMVPHTLGFISNITREKGIFEFIQVVIRLHEIGIDIRAHIAGPFENESIRNAVLTEILPYPFIQYVGAKYGKEKSDFFSLIDVLLFPTKNESEGLVIHEAMSRGIPVIAFARGCIEQIITTNSGKVISPSCDYVAEAAQVLQEWCASTEQFLQVSKSARQRFEWLKTNADQSVATLISNLSV